MDTWAREEIPGYGPENPALSYGDLIGLLFLTPEDRQREIENLCDGRTPSFGYAVLAQLVAMERGRFNVVLTTNFDDLIADALYLYTDARPLVIHHESLAAFIRPTRTRPLIVKLHGDHRLSPRNTALETQELEQETQRHTAMALHDRGVIFMGYGGADVGILKLLNDLPREALPFGAYWVHPHEPHGEIREWLARRQGVWVRSGWFDEVMLLVRNEFDLPHPRADRFNRIFHEYHKKFGELSASIQAKPAGEAGVQALKKALSDAEALFPDYWKVISEARRLESQDPDRADEVYRQGVTQFPQAAPLLGNYANFLADNRKEYDAAEAMYKRAMEADPKDADYIGNYAAFLSDNRKDYDAAEAMFKRAMEADPKDAVYIGNYAAFLSDNRKDYDAAEAMFKRAMEADPKDAVYIGNYAAFLSDNRKDYDAAEAMFKRAIEADPKHANNISNYASFLADNRKDYDAAEAMFKRAIEADPKHANNISNYASFLADNRKDYDAAEAMFKRAIEADPKHAISRLNFAGFLLANGNADGLAVLRGALESLRENPLPRAELEYAVYLFAHGSQSQRADALRTTRRLLESGVRSPFWDLSRNVERARLDGHPEAPWLAKLAAVINDDAQPEVLNNWSAWNSAAA